MSTPLNSHPARMSWLPWLAALPLSLGASIAAAQIAFVEVGATAKVNNSTESFGASWGDLNADGYLDIYANNHRLQDSLYLNRGDGTFLETQKQVGQWVNHPGFDTHGGAFGDFDNDGDQDLLISSGIGNIMELLRNENGRLVDRTAQFGLTKQPSDIRSMMWFDFNRDKKLDFVTVMGGASRLFQQNATGTGFTNITNSKFLCTASQFGQLYDATDDGRLDFLCPSEALYPQKIWNYFPFPFVKVFDNATPTPLFPLVSNIVDSTIADFDNDGRLDNFIISGVQMRPSAVVQNGPNYFEAGLIGGVKGFRFTTPGTVTFAMDWNKADEGTEVSLGKIDIGAGAFHPTAIPFTLDPNDSAVAGMPPPPLLDSDLPVMQIGFDPLTKRWTAIIQTKLPTSTKTVFSAAYVQVTTALPLTNLQSSGLWDTDGAAPPTLLSNLPGGRIDTTVAAGLSTPIQCISATSGDYDNDMDVDLYLACRTGASNIANILYENQGNGTFVAVPNAGGAVGPIGISVASGAGASDSAITGDYDVDGFLDIFVSNGLNMRPVAIGGPNSLFKNQGANTNHWVELDLVGTLSDRDATGARVTATAINGPQQLRVQNGGFHRWSHDAKRIHFGLAANTLVTLRVDWPSGAVETFTDVAADKLYRITEGTGIAPVVLGEAPAYICGPPTLSGAVDRGIFIWRDCPTGEWRMKTASAGGNITYQGTVTSTAAFTSVKPQGIGVTDTVDFTTNPLQIAFTFVTKFTSTKGVNFKVVDGSSTCLNLSAPSNVQVFVGPFKKLVAQPFNLDTQLTCP